jgi:hypothetical protein
MKRSGGNTFWPAALFLLGLIFPPPAPSAADLIAIGGVIGSQTDLGLPLWNDLPLAYDTREDRWLKIEGPLLRGALFNDPGVCILDDTIYVAGAEGPSGTHFNYWLVGKIVVEK